MTPDSEGYDLLAMGQQSIVKCLNPHRDAGDWAPLARDVESHSDRSACHSFLSTTSRYEKNFQPECKGMGYSGYS